MSSLRAWTILLILYQTTLCVIIVWWTLDCRFSPQSSELQEVTLMKLLYLYDPQACGRVQFYNITTTATNSKSISSIMWPTTNNIASSFRRKVRLWLFLHVVWLLLSVVNVTHGARPCGFYAALVPFTLTGLTLLVVDLIFTGFFLNDLHYTKTELAILNYINLDHNLQHLNKCWWRDARQSQVSEDTSWISLLFAYVSCRGVVQWIINFWLVKDNYFAGLAIYRHNQKEKSKRITKV